MHGNALRCLAAGLALLAGGCLPGTESNVERARRDGVLHLGNKDEPQELDPHLVSGLPELHILHALFEGLVGRDGVDLAIVPGVAETWSRSDDGRSYTFRLRHDARWSNGEPLGAADFVWSWRRALSPALGNPNAYLMFPIRNARLFHRGEAGADAVGIAALDRHTLRVDLQQPLPHFLQLLAHHAFFPVHRATIERHGGIDERGTAWTRPGRMVSNGPFMLTEWQMNRVVAVARNPEYHDAASIRLNGIRFYPVTNASTEERMFRAGQLHVTDLVPPEKIKAYRARSGGPLRITPYFATYFYRLNTTAPPLDDARVRRALAISIDRERIVRHITKGEQQPARALTPPDPHGYRPPTVWNEDREQARRLLDAAGYPDGRGFPPLEIMFNNDETHLKVAVAIQQMWKDALGIDVRLTNQDWQVHLDRERRLRYQVTRGSWIGDTLDPTTFLNLFRSDSGNNRTGWSNAEYDSRLDAAAAADDPDRRMALLAEAETLLLEEVPLIPIYIYTRITLVSPEVRGWHSNLLDLRRYQDLWLEEVPPAPAPAAGR